MIERIESERGSILIEVLVSAVMLVITAVGVFSAFEAGNRASAEERHRAQAEGLAQADLTRMRTMRISDLVNLHETKVVTIAKTPYTVDSVATFQTDENGTASCEDGEEVSADYIEIRSTVSWPTLGTRKAVVQSSLVAPPNGSVSANSGSLAIQIENAESGGVREVGLNGTGPDSFAGVTGEHGCAIFGDLPAGNYTVTLTSPSSVDKLIDKNGEAPKPVETSVVEESTATLVLQYDFGGTIEAKFQTWIGGELAPSSGDSVVVFNSHMQQPKAFGTPGTPQEEVTASPVFPFASPYVVYAGSCQKDDPGEAAPEDAVAEGTVSPKGTTEMTLNLPPLNLTAWSGSEAEPGEAVEGATVKIEDSQCAAELKEGEESAPPRTYSTDAKGHLPDPGLPYSDYSVCVSNEGEHVNVSSVAVPADVEKPEEGATLNVFLGSTAAIEGECP